MEKNYATCSFLYSNVISSSVPYYSLFVRCKKRIIGFEYLIWSSFKNNFYPKKITKEMASKTSSFSNENNTLNLKPGEWVQVRSIDEISETLDGRGKNKGLYFMPEMEKFCGKNFKVFKRAQVIKLESTGEVRKLKTPSIFLEGVYCTGEERNEWCDRACFHFWREVWLKRISDKKQD